MNQHRVAFWIAWKGGDEQLVAILPVDGQIPRRQNIRGKKVTAGPLEKH